MPHLNLDGGRAFSEPEVHNSARARLVAAEGSPDESRPSNRSAAEERGRQEEENKFGRIEEDEEERRRGKGFVR